MKKIVYLLMIIGVLFTSCDPLEDINDVLDAQEKPVVGEDEITMTSDDYDALSLDFESFNSVDEAKVLLPPFLGDRYPFFGEGSSVIVNYNLFDGNPEEVSVFANAETYQLASGDYPTAASNAFFPNENPLAFLENIVTNQFSSPTEEQVVRVEYKQFIEEPVVGFAPLIEFDFAGSFEGWSVTDVVGTEGWTSETEYVQGNGFSGGQQVNEDWLISPEIDLTNESDLRFQISQAIRFATDLSLVKILVATDYTGDQTTATWNEINLATAPAGDSDTFILSEDYDFTAYDGQMIHIAFKYESTSSDAARWRIESLVLKTIGIEGDTETKSAFYIYKGGDWDVAEEAYYLTREDYDSMGEDSGQPGRFNNFSGSVLPENYLPTFLRINYPFAQEEEELFLIYRFFEGGAVGTVTKGNLYTVINGVWVPSISTLQFGHDGSSWVPDNTIRHSLTAADISFISDTFSTVSGFEGPADNLGFFGSFDRRSSSSNFWNDEMLLEAFNALLDNIDPSAAEGQKYVLDYVIFNGSLANESFSLIKTGGVWVRNE